MNEFDVVSATITGFLFRRYSASLNCDDNGCSLSSLTPSSGWQKSVTDRGQSVDCGFYIGSMIGLDVVGGEAVTHRIP